MGESEIGGAAKNPFPQGQLEIGQILEKRLVVARWIGGKPRVNAWE